MTNIFLVMATLIFLALSVVWTGGQWFNIFLKFGFIGMTIFGAIVTAQALGYIVKVPA